MPRKTRMQGNQGETIFDFRPSIYGSSGPVLGGQDRGRGRTIKSDGAAIMEDRIDHLVAGVGRM